MAMLNARSREGVTHGDGQGDLLETTAYASMVEALRRYVDQEFVADPDSPVVEAVSYYGLENGDGRLDVAGLDASGAVVVGGEAERINNDVVEKAPRDFDQLAELGVEEAIWVGAKRSAVHKAILRPLNEPADGEPRIDHAYSSNTSIRDVSPLTPGLTDVFTMQLLTEALDR
jgi:hypothetical protein